MGEPQEVSLSLDLTRLEDDTTAKNIDTFTQVIEDRIQVIRESHFGENAVTTYEDMKKDKATINKLQKKINDYRIEKEKEYMKPFETQVKSKLNVVVKDLKALYDELNQRVIEIDMKEKDEVKVLSNPNAIKVKYELEIPNEETKKELEMFMIKNNINFKIK